MKAGNFHKAVSKYSKAIKLHNDPVFYGNRAAAYCSLQKYDLAIEVPYILFHTHVLKVVFQDCRSALSINRNYAKAYNCMGSAFCCQNRYGEAVKAYKNALIVFPENEVYKNNLALSEIKVRDANALKEVGNISMKASRFQDAVTKYTEAININRDPVYYCNRAAAYSFLRQYNFAVQVVIYSFLTIWT